MRTLHGHPDWGRALGVFLCVGCAASTLVLLWHLPSLVKHVALYVYGLALSVIGALS